MRIGYACMNGTIRDAGHRRRRLLMHQFKSDGGLELVSEAAAENINTLAAMIGWNEQHGIKILRITDIFPWMDKYQFEDLPQWNILQNSLTLLNEIINKWDHRITVHPSSFCVLASPNTESVYNSIVELNANGRLFDLFGFARSTFNKINIHVGGIYGDKLETMKRFCQTFKTLDSSVKDRLTIENDDGRNGYTVEDLYQGIYQEIGIPIVMDVFHHELNPGNLTEDAALELAFSTWKDKTPVIHLSSSKRDHEDPKTSRISHADYIYRSIPVLTQDADIMVEAKKTEMAVLRLKENL